MSDLISRSELIEELKESLDDTALQHTLEFFGVYDIIRSQPTVEAIPVVRCKECEQWGKIKHPAQTERIKVCGWGRYFTGENGYCVYGKKVE